MFIIFISLFTLDNYMCIEVIACASWLQCSWASESSGVLPREYEVLWPRATLWRRLRSNVWWRPLRRCLLEDRCCLHVTSDWESPVSHWVCGCERGHSCTQDFICHPNFGLFRPTLLPSKISAAATQKENSALWSNKNALLVFAYK